MKNSSNSSTYQLVVANNCSAFIHSRKSKTKQSPIQHITGESHRCHKLVAPVVDIIGLVHSQAGTYEHPPIIILFICQ